MMRRVLLHLEQILWLGMVPLIVFLLPWNARLIFHQSSFAGQTIEGATLSFSAIEALVWLAVVLLAILVICGGWSGRVLRRAPWSAIVIFIVWAFLSVTWSHSLGTIQTGLRLTAAALLGYLLWQHPRREHLRDIFIASACLQAVIALLQVAVQEVSPSTVLGVAWHVPWDGPASVVEWTGGRLLRAYGTLPHPNVLGGFLAVGWIFALTAIRQGRGRYAYSIAAALCAMGLVVTFSRSAWIAAAVGAMVVLVSAVSSPRLLLAMTTRFAVAVIPAVVVILLFLPFATTRLAASGRLESRSIQERVSTLADGRALAFQHPVLGVGAGFSTTALWQSGALPEPPHAVPLVVFLELGVVGFVLLVWVIIGTARIVSGSPRGLAMLAALAALMLLDHYLWTGVSGLFLGVAALVLVSDPPTT